MKIEPLAQKDVPSNRYRPVCRLQLWPIDSVWRSDDLLFEIKLTADEKWPLDLEKAINYDLEYRSSYPRGVNDVRLLDGQALIRVDRVIQQISEDDVQTWLASYLADLLAGRQPDRPKPIKRLDSHSWRLRRGQAIRERLVELNRRPLPGVIITSARWGRIRAIWDADRLTRDQVATWLTKSGLR